MALGDSRVTATVTATAAANPRRGHTTASSPRSDLTTRTSSPLRLKNGRYRPVPFDGSGREACPRDVPELPSTANDRHQQQPANMKLVQALNPRAAHGNTLVMRSSPSWTTTLPTQVAPVEQTYTPNSRSAARRSRATEDAGTSRV
jgi:hypothetical protein